MKREYGLILVIIICILVGTLYSLATKESDCSPHIINYYSNGDMPDDLDKDEINDGRTVTHYS